MEQVHTITKFELALHIPAGGYASVARENIARICRERLLPTLQRLFDSWSGPDEYLVLDRLEIVVTANSMHQLEQKLVDEVIKKIIAQFDPSVSFSASHIVFSKKNRIQNYFDHWIYFLQHGRLPVTAILSSENQWQQDILERLATYSDAKQQCREVLNRSPLAIERLVSQFDQEFLKKWAASFGGYPSMRIFEILMHWIQLFSEAVMIETIRKSAPAFSVPSSFTHNSFYCLVKAMVYAEEPPSPHVFITQLLHSCLNAKEHQLVISALIRIQPGNMRLPSQTRRAIEALRPIFVALAEPVSGVTTETKEKKSSAEPANNFNKTELEQDHQPPTSNSEIINTEMPNKEELKKDQEAAQQADPVMNANSYSIEKIFPEKNLQTSDEHQVISEALYINNAGLVILHPYLFTLFDYLGLLEDHSFRDIDSRNRAVQLLSWLAHAETGLPEHQLMLPKILCGIPHEQTIDRFAELRDDEKEEADSLLKAVIENWKAVRNVSPNGLRANFLLREGKLEWKSDEWRLRVTQTTPDILLERLPWSISIIRLPWMKHYLKTEWV